MPKPVPLDMQVLYRARGLLDRSKCAELIGAICANWSDAEQKLARYYADLLFGVFKDGIPPRSGRWAAMQSFDCVNSFTQRIAMLKIAAARHFHEDTVTAFGKKRWALKNAGDERIIAAHGRWGVSEDCKDAIIWMRGAGNFLESQVYEMVDLEKSLDQIVNASDDLERFFETNMVPALKAFAENVIGQG